MEYQRKQIKSLIGYHYDSKNTISKENSDWAKDRGILREVRKVNSWLIKKTGRGFIGSVAIGKHYSTLLLDVAYQDGTISINADNCQIKLMGKPINSYKEFSTEFDKYYELIEN